jgi:hypothetical protein
MTNTANLRKLRSGPGSGQVVTRENESVLKTAIAVEQPPREAPSTLVVIRIPIRGGSSTSLPHFLQGDPIHQLEASRNPAPRQPPAIYHDDKAGDFSRFAQNIDIVKTHPQRQSQRRNILRMAHDVAIINAGSTAHLGYGLNGHAVYAAPRFKPALPNGRADLPAVTGQQGYTGSYLLTTAPAKVEGNLAVEEYNASFNRSAMPVARNDSITISTARLGETSTYNTQVQDEKGTPTESAGKSAGKLIFLVAAVLIAFWVLKR